MKSHYECIEELDALAAEMHGSSPYPEHPIYKHGMSLDYGMTDGALTYRPATTPDEDKPALEFTASNYSAGLHRYSMFRESGLVIVQFRGTSLRKNEIRKPKAHEDIPVLSKIGRIEEPIAFGMLTVTGLRRLVSDLTIFKEHSAILAR